MSSVLDTLTPEQYAEVVETVRYRHLERELVSYGFSRLLEQELIRTITVPNPGTGSEFFVSTPAGANWELIGVTFRLTTSAVVATRLPKLLITDSTGSEIWRFSVVAGIAASATNTFAWLAGLGASINLTGQQVMIPAPPLVLAAGQRVASQASSFDAGDAYSQISVSVREWTPPGVINAIRSLLVDLDSAGGIRYPGR